MPDRFLSYLQNERGRLGRELDRALSEGATPRDIARLDRLCRAVDDQLARWSSDLASGQLAA